MTMNICKSISTMSKLLPVITDDSLHRPVDKQVNDTIYFWKLRSPGFSM